MQTDEAERSPSRVRGLWPYLLVAALYLLTSPFHHGLNNPNEMVRVYMTKAAVDDHTFVIDRVLTEWGGVDDKAIRAGKLYSSKAPLQSLVGIPVYAALEAAGFLDLDKRHLTWILRIFGSTIPTLAFVLVLLAYARKRAALIGSSELMGTSVGLSIALGTMLYPYAITFTGHALAATAAGGCHLVLMGLSRSAERPTRIRTLSFLLGLLGGAAPFAEYPAALVAAPAILAAPFVVPRRSIPKLVALAVIGGALTFGVGLWAHQELWGSPLKTGYSFLENQVYAHSHHGSGFFGVKAPRLNAFLGSTFSPATGLFFYSPFLLLGLVGFGRELGRGSEQRAPAIAAIASLVLSLLFISGHSHWRGGWTVGPRYIVSVAPLLGLWVIEALAMRRAAYVVPALGALSIIVTGFAAALYPHLSDVYTNPVGSFVWPSYLGGYASYGVASSLGLDGHLANLPHVALLVFAIGFVLSSFRRPMVAAISVAVVLASTAAVILLPERDLDASRRENARLWGFWEPPRAAERAHAFKASSRFDSVRVEAEDSAGRKRPCVKVEAERCSYGDQPWHHFAPELLTVSGAAQRVLFMHPIAGQTVRATILGAKEWSRGLLKVALTDESLASDNQSPVHVRFLEGHRILFEGETRDEPGFVEVPFTRSTSEPLVLEISVARDGARVLGFDVLLDP
ncbi:MAG: hypothetical protein HYV07_12720 [Deltaproteobacteria bacterium]|nr:hypothetical protein [Deltaproteobacteria bacterium]